MDRNSFIENYISAFLGTLAATKYSDPYWSERVWVNRQPVNDARAAAEEAWSSIEKNYKDLFNVPPAISSVAVQEVPKILQPEVQSGITGVVEKTI